MAIGFMGGVLLGIIFFGGLYWSVQMIGRVKYPGPLMAVSAIIRMSVLLLGIYFLGGHDIKRILAILTGVILVKFLVVFNVGKKSRSPE